MSFEEYRGKSVVIRSTGVSGKIDDLIRRKGPGGGLSVRFLVIDSASVIYELMPHEVKIIENEKSNGAS